MNIQNKMSNQSGCGRRSYQRPAISEVPLRPEESVLSLCKVGSDSGAIFGTACSTCATEGS